MILSIRINNFAFNMMKNEVFAKRFEEELFEPLGRYFVHTDAETINNLVKVDTAIPPRNERKYWVWFLDEDEKFTLTLEENRLSFNVMTNKYMPAGHPGHGVYGVDGMKFYEHDVELADVAVKSLKAAFGIA